VIGKVTFGSGVRGLTRYLTAEREAGLVGYVTGDTHELGAVAYRNLAAEMPADAAREMALVSRLSARCEKPFMHLSLSWHPDERPEEGRMLDAMDRMLSHLGLEDRQAVYAVHREKEHLHVHAVVNRVGREGTAWDRWQCKERISAQCRVLEREMGFEGIEKHLRPERERERILTPREQRILERSGVEPPEHVRSDKDELLERIGKEARAVLRKAETWQQAHERLRDRGMALEAYEHPKTSRTGLQLVEIATGERVAASALGSDYGRRALEKRLGAFEPSRVPERSIENVRPQIEEQARTPTRSAGERSSPGAEEPARRAEPSRRSLWDEYASERAQQRSERDRALERQREHEKERRGNLRSEHRARMERVRTFPGPVARALGSECAFAYASAREELDRSIAREREGLRELHRGRTWTDYVVSRAGLGDERALDQLRRWAEREERGLEVGDSIGKPEGRERTPPTVRTLQDGEVSPNRRKVGSGFTWRDTQ
jgi:Relaxase/Mobilisation nuclease domain